MQKAHHTFFPDILASQNGGSVVGSVLSQGVQSIFPRDLCHCCLVDIALPRSLQLQTFPLGGGVPVRFVGRLEIGCLSPSHILNFYDSSPFFDFSGMLHFVAQTWGDVETGSCHPL